MTVSQVLPSGVHGRRMEAVTSPAAMVTAHVHVRVSQVDRAQTALGLIACVTIDTKRHKQTPAACRAVNVSI